MYTFGERLKKLRRSQKVKQKTLADHLKIAMSTLSQYENNKRHPNFNILIEIANYFSVSTDYLLGVEDQKIAQLAQNIEIIDASLEDPVSYYDLIQQITEHLVIIRNNEDQKSLQILHNLYDAISKIGRDYTYDTDTYENIEDILGQHLAQKEDIDQTLNQLFRHHLKFYARARKEK